MFGIFFLVFLLAAVCGFEPVAAWVRDCFKRFSSLSFAFSSLTLASSSISCGVFVFCYLKKKFTIVDRITESQKMQAVRDFAPLGKGESSLYWAVTL